MHTFKHLAVVTCRSALLAGMTAGLLSACAPTTPQWDATFGDSVRAAVAQQILNPQASQNPDPVSGMDGPAAREAMSRYQKSFKDPQPQPNVFTIGVGNGGSSGGGQQ